MEAKFMMTSLQISRMGHWKKLNLSTKKKNDNGIRRKGSRLEAFSLVA